MLPLRDGFLPHILRERRGKAEVRFRHFKTGEALWMIHTALVLRDRRGNVAGLAGIGLNISDRRLAEDELRRSRSELELRVTPANRGTLDHQRPAQAPRSLSLHGATTQPHGQREPQPAHRRTLLDRRNLPNIRV